MSLMPSVQAMDQTTRQLLSMAPLQIDLVMRYSLRDRYTVIGTKTLNW